MGKTIILKNAQTNCSLLLDSNLKKWKNGNKEMFYRKRKSEENIFEWK